MSERDLHLLGRPQYSVCQFFSDGTHEYVVRFVRADEALPIAGRIISGAGAKLGTTQRVIVTDGGDSCVFEWQYGKGITIAERLPL